jgi:hypothetical protein
LSVTLKPQSSPQNPFSLFHKLLKHKLYHAASRLAHIPLNKSFTITTYSPSKISESTFLMKKLMWRKDMTKLESFSAIKRTAGIRVDKKIFEDSLEKEVP